jgi:uncharacterized protein (TIGR00255 family)
MTGYGKGEAASPAGRFVVEIRAVNSRYAEVTVKLPRSLLALEGEVKRLVTERIKRGKVDVFVQRDGIVGPDALPKANIPLAKAYHDAFLRMKEALGLPDPISLFLLAGQKDVLTTSEAESTPEEVKGDLLAAVAGAIVTLEGMRGQEGAALLADLQGRLGTVDALLGGVAERAPRSVAANAERLRERVLQLAGESGVDEARLAQEVAILADRGDISEELVRFRSHQAQFAATLELAEPVGRKLDFLLQEMNREVNTVGSKAGDLEIAALVVELKAELEKIREQVQNVE